MRNVSRFVLVITTVIGGVLWPNEVFAATPAKVAISEATSTVKGQISANGTYSVTEGWTVTNIVIRVSPTAGGVKPPDQATQYGNGTWKGVVTGLESGVQYDVQAVMTIKTGTVNSEVVSAISKVTVQ